MLNSVVRSSQTLHHFLRNVSTLYSKESQRKVYWQEAISLFCGSKILSTVSQAIVANSDLAADDHQWFSDGKPILGLACKQHLCLRDKLDCCRVRILDYVVPGNEESNESRI